MSFGIVECSLKIIQINFLTNHKIYSNVYIQCRQVNYSENEYDLLNFPIRTFANSKNSIIFVWNINIAIFLVF